MTGCLPISRAANRFQTRHVLPSSPPVDSGTLSPLLLLQVYLAEWFSTQVAVKVLIVVHVANASDAQRALSLSVPILHKLEAEASLLASLRRAEVALGRLIK